MERENMKRDEKDGNIAKRKQKGEYEEITSEMKSHVGPEIKKMKI